MSANMDASTAQLVSGKKRSASDSELQTVEGDVGKEQAEDAGQPSLKRLKGNGPSKEVEIPDSKSLDASPSPEDSATSQALSKAHGWNRGISSGLRTSFAGKDQPPKPLPQQASESPVQPPAGEVDVNGLAMPSGDVDFQANASKSAWQARFLKWCVRLLALNKDREEVKDPVLMREAWGVWLETHISPIRGQRRLALRAADLANLDSDKLQEMVSKALETDLQGPWIEPPAETGQPESIKSEQQSDGQPGSNKSTPQGSLDMNGWILPPPQSTSEFRVRQKDRASMEEKFVGWCRSLIQLNETAIKVRTPKERNRLTDAYSRWVGTVEGLTKVKAAAARRAAGQYAQDNSALLAAVFASTAPASRPQVTESISSPQEDSAPPPVVPSIAPPVAPPIAAVPNGSNHGPVDLVGGEEDAEYREKYFPGLGPDEAFCSMCASRGHDAVACPEMTCRFCRDHQHRSFSCPTRQRCTKCKQLGHVKKDCTEKLALPKEEVECAFCQSRDHVDASCHELWRSFRLQPDAVRKVRSLPVFCYCCGRQGHHGAACGLNPEKPREGPWDTWAQANCDRYLDPASSEMAIVYEASAGQGSSSERPDLGKSIVPKRHIFFEEADDDDEGEDFIRPPVQKNARVGHISFSGNNGGASRGDRRPNRQFNDRNGRSQPPLPPGPPPPLPPQEYRRNGGGGGGSGGGGRRRGGGARY